MHDIHADVGPFDGIIWHSRQAEVRGYDDLEVAVVFGDCVGVERGDWASAQPGVSHGGLQDGRGLEEVMDVAETLAVVLDIDLR